MGPNWALEAWARDTWYFLDFQGGSRKAPNRGGRVVIVGFGGLLPTNKLANYLLSTKPTTYYQAQQNSRYRTTGLHLLTQPGGP